ncbi:transmembrane protein 45B-like [Amphiura filiformis]|uniref:transmembrane protein 45B-like n=1 Tax=Amphiura filiformis TaxID=82378 RepID=UPI003B21980D
MQGTFAGHATPGIMFILLAIWHAIKQAHNNVKLGNKTVVRFPAKYLKHRNKSFTEKNYQTGFEPMEMVTIVRDAPLFPHDILVAGAFFLACAIGGTLGLLGYRRFEIMDGKGHFSSNLNNWQHGTMFTFFGLYFGIVILGQTKYKLQPEMEKLFQSLAFFVEAFLFYFHLEGRDDPLDVHLHHLLIIACTGSAVCLLVQAWKLGDPLLDNMWVVFLLLHGMWFLMVGFVLYNPIQNSTTWDKDPMMSMMMATALFTWQLLLAIIINSLIRWIVWFLVTRNHGNNMNSNNNMQFVDEFCFKGDPCFQAEETAEMTNLLDETKNCFEIDEGL